MVNFQITLPKESVLPLQGRIVESVYKTSTIHPIFGKMTTWRGALENEYFSILFIGGVLVVSVAEREYQLGHVSVNYAESKSLLDMAELIKGSSSEMKIELQKDYNVISKKEQDEVKFEDLLPILDWRYAQFAKVDETDMLGD
jgi:hypothetical protein